LNSGLFADSLRQAGTLAAIISSRAHEVIAKISIMVNNIFNSPVYVSCLLFCKNYFFLGGIKQIAYITTIEIIISSMINVMGIKYSFCI
jgi:hypothetical protein